ncbi:hypothetical protein [Agrobacterium tumefaciens]|uniref:hypothetical protein n=1 Tax=Agrobacterium tumefaciens TaxID=358 RepID=UPI00130104A0
MLSWTTLLAGKAPRFCCGLTWARPGQRPLALKLAQDAGLPIIWQQPCHEALLSRHLSNAQQLQPQSTVLALIALTAKWASYTKGMPAAKRAVTINADGLRRVRTVEHSFDALLADLGFE